MKKQLRSLVATVGAVALLATMTPGSTLALTSAAVDPIAGQVTSDPSHQLAPAISGERVVWRDLRNGNWDIYGYDAATGRELVVCTDPSLQQNPAISGERVVWQDYRNGDWDIYAYDLATGVESRLTSDASIQQNPAIAGDTVVWEDYRNGNWDIYAYDLATGTERQVTSSTARQRAADVWASTVVWEDNRDGDADIWMLDLSGGSEAALTDTAWDEGEPDVCGNRVTWQTYEAGNWDIVLHELSSGRTQRITTDSSTQSRPHLAAGTVAWQDYRNGNWDIYLYDAATDEVKQITSDPGSQWTVESDGTDIAWEDFRNGNGDIYMARLVVSVTRSAGDDRYGTAGKGLDSAWPEGADTVVIATGAGFADALAASGLAGRLDAPLLLTRPEALPDVAADHIVALGATRAVVVGGERAVAARVLEQLTQLGLSVRRIAGSDRYQTAKTVALEMLSVSGQESLDRGFLVRGDEFADALAVAPFAYHAGIPVFLTDPGSLRSPTREAMRALGTVSVVIAGGPGAVSERVEADLPFPAERVAGHDRYATALAIAEYGTEAGWGDWRFVGIATGADFPDALSGGTVTGRHGGVLLMTPSDTLDPLVQRALTTRATVIDEVHVFGGTAAVSDTVFLQLARTQ